MEESALREGDILKIGDTSYRIIYISSPYITLCQMGISKLEIHEYDLLAIRTGILKGDITIHEDCDYSVVDMDRLSESEKMRFEERKEIMAEVRKVYGPSYVGLSAKNTKDEVESIISTHDLSRSSFWRTCHAYFQSGMKESSLLRKKRSPSAESVSGKKRGSKGDLGISAGCPRSDYVIEAFNFGLKFYKSGRSKSYSAAYDHMNNHFFFHDVMVNGKKQNRLLPADERPTFRQFYYYCSKHITKEEMDALKTSRMEQRNDRRLLFSESSIDVEAPGEKVEADSLEVDLSLISITNSATGQSVGRCVVYAMKDILTEAVVAIAVSFENNSFLGLTNLFLNLGDDKVNYCAKYGIDLKDSKYFPSCFLPMELYVDRGSDYKSDPAQKLLNSLGITRHLVPGGTGSLKGVIEQWFHQIHAMINPYTEGAGQIQKRYDSKHHKQAALNVNEFTKMLITCVIVYNQSHLNRRKSRTCEIRDNVDATPSVLWDYYCRTKGAPRPIENRFDYYYKLLVPRQAKVDKLGIHFNKLTYINYDDDYLLDMMYRMQRKKANLDVRYDPRDNSRLYYVDSTGNLVYAGLNEGLAWQKDLKGLTFKETNDYFKSLAASNKEATQRNQEGAAMRAAVIEDIVETAKANNPSYAETKNMREAREREKQLVNKQNTITERLDREEANAKGIETESGAATLPNKDEDAERADGENMPVALTDEEYNHLVSHFHEYETEE